MPFIRYYNKLLDAEGVPHLSAEQYKRLVNISYTRNKKLESMSLQCLMKE